MPAFDAKDDIVDRSHNGTRSLPAYVGLSAFTCEEGVQATVEQLEEFEGWRFGHISYLPEFAEALQQQRTKVLFNVRDPRDVVVSEYYNILKKTKKGAGQALWNFIMDDGVSILDSGDPIKYLITFASCRWPNWLGWMSHDFVYTVKYEDLRLSGIETLGKIREFLAPEIKIDVAKIFSRLKPEPMNSTFRKGIPGEWKDVFTNEHKALADDLLGDIIEELGYVV